MILIEDKVENVKITVEVDENEDHHFYSGCPILKTDGYTCLFEAVDVLTVLKAIKTSETVDEFITKVQDTWQKDNLAKPIIRELNDKSLNNVFDETIKVLDYSFTDENKELFDFGNNHNSGLYRALSHYASEYDGEFYKLDKNEQTRYLVQSALADC